MILLATILLGVWMIDHTVHVWLVAALVLPYTRFAWKIALAMAGTALALSTWIVAYKWQVDSALQLRYVLSGCLLLAVLSVFFRAWEGARDQLAATTNTLENKLQTITQGITVFGSDGRVKLFNAPSSRLLNLPEALLLQQPTL
ncbi:MAG: hypothetical protein ACKOCJ_05585 [Burkholderiaceae bacterium]